MKKLLSSLLALVVVLSCGSLCAGALDVQVNGTPIVWTDAQPFVDQNNRTLVPLRAVADAMGLEVIWDGANSQATFSQDTSTSSSFMVFTVGSNIALRSYFENGTTTDFAITMDTAPVIVDGRVYAPVRYLAEHFGYPVAWDGNTGTIYLGNYNLPSTQNYAGRYGDEYDSLSIQPVDNGCQVEMSLYRLCSMEGTATLDGDHLVVYFIDPSGHSMYATIEKTGGNLIRVTITQSTWEYIHTGDVFEFSA